MQITTHAQSTQAWREMNTIMNSAPDKTTSAKAFEDWRAIAMAHRDGVMAGLNDEDCVCQYDRTRPHRFVGGTCEACLLAPDDERAGDVCSNVPHQI